MCVSVLYYAHHQESLNLNVEGAVKLELNSDDDCPKIDKSAYVHATAVIIGNVKIGKNVFVGPGAVLRADEPESQIVIGDDCNVQDRVVVHALQGSTVSVRLGSSLSHGCIVHGPCEVGAGSFIGFGAVVFSSILAENIFVGHLALVVGVTIPAGRSVPNHHRVETLSGVQKLSSVSREQEDFMLGVVQMNKKLAKEYKGFPS